MDLRQMRYFLAIAQEGQVTRAAKVLNMEQPPLSRQLKLIEQELGVTLFDRGSKRMNLTPAGQLLKERAESFILQFEETLREVKRLDQGIEGTLSIGSVVSCISLLPSPIELFRKHFPAVKFKITEGDHFLLGDQLLQGHIEVVLARLPFEADSGSHVFESLPLPSDPYVAVVPTSLFPEHTQPSFLMKQLADMPFLTLKTDHTTRMHEQVLKECRHHNFEPNIVCECSSVAVIVALVAAGIGATVLPKSVMRAFPIPAIRILPIIDATFHSEVGLVWVKDRYLSKSAQRFIQECAITTQLNV
ncbi:DNA-binding transcriptional LysR family regulator [Paenibacillus shirakamiensis]|uniref:DNA-binding transcriptional LysR family regulator n=1 Tax=Paenibacillus shirakamiensis TaxID=1265935 RepID=A0ABS4JH19_9BACL|nr:LysR family transcriptional regulator [Paenibacillus shirakamiensis]MBP2001021.1 DNA-binding transcriptional LysR family regulator [Paenibacillus shirakamiensis]